MSLQSLCLEESFEDLNTEVRKLMFSIWEELPAAKSSPEVDLVRRVLSTTVG